MRKISTILLALFAISSSAHASCLDQYKERRDGNFLSRASEKFTGTGGTAITIGILAGSPELMMVGFPVLAIGGGIMLTQEARYNRMIHLIEDADAYTNGGENAIPSKRLTRFHKKVDVQNLTMLRLANLISQANLDGSLCSEGNLIFYRSLANSVQKKEIAL